MANSNTSNCCTACQHLRKSNDKQYLSDKISTLYTHCAHTTSQSWDNGFLFHLTSDKMTRYCRTDKGHYFFSWLRYTYILEQTCNFSTLKDSCKLIFYDRHWLTYMVYSVVIISSPFLTLYTMQSVLTYYNTMIQPIKPYHIYLQPSIQHGTTHHLM